MRNLEMAAACRIPNWQADIEPIQIKLIGKGILPALHLSLPESGTPHENTHDISLTQTKVSDYHIRILPIGMGIKTRAPNFRNFDFRKFVFRNFDFRKFDFRNFDFRNFDFRNFDFRNCESHKFPALEQTFGKRFRSEF